MVQPPPPDICNSTQFPLKIRTYWCQYFQKEDGSYAAIEGLRRQVEGKMNSHVEAWFIISVFVSVEI